MKLTLIALVMTSLTLVSCAPPFEQHGPKERRPPLPDHPEGHTEGPRLANQTRLPHQKDDSVDVDDHTGRPQHPEKPEDHTEIPRSQGNHPGQEGDRRGPRKARDVGVARQKGQDRSEDVEDHTGRPQHTERPEDHTEVPRGKGNHPGQEGDRRGPRKARDVRVARQKGQDRSEDVEDHTGRPQHTKRPEDHTEVPRGQGNHTRQEVRHIEKSEDHTEEPRGQGNHPRQESDRKGPRKIRNVRSAGRKGQDRSEDIEDHTGRPEDHTDLPEKQHEKRTEATNVGPGKPPKDGSEKHRH